MKVLVSLGLFLFLGVSSIYGDDRSCGKLILSQSSKIKTHFDALKVYKKVENRTEMYRERMRDDSNVERNLAAMRAASVVEKKFLLQMAKLAYEDMMDKSSEVVLLCVGRMRMSEGIRHFMFSVTKDEEGDSFWSASLY